MLRAIERRLSVVDRVRDDLLRGVSGCVLLGLQISSRHGLAHPSSFFPLSSFCFILPNVSLLLIVERWYSSSTIIDW